MGLAYDDAVAGSGPGIVQEGLAIWRVPGIPGGGRAAEHLGSTDLRPAGSMLWQPGQITPELAWPDGTPTGIRVGPIDHQRGAIEVAWWSNRFPLFIYGVRPDGQLAWHRHDGALVGGGLESWGAMQIVGTGWQGLAHVFSAGNGIIYAVSSDGDLRWYRHGGYREGGGLETWEPQDTGYRVVGSGWRDLRHVFWGGNGVIYAVAPNGELRWYKHDGYPNGGGLATWEPQDTGYRVVGQGQGQPSPEKVPPAGDFGICSKTLAMLRSVYGSRHSGRPDSQGMSRHFPRVDENQSRGLRARRQRSPGRDLSDRFRADQRGRDY
jgi:hypothetical protein